MAVSGVIEAHVRARTQNFDAGMKRVARTLGSLARGMTAGITAVAASASAMEKSWTAMGVNVLAAFAVGGPIGAGMAALGAAIGLVIGKHKELEEAQEKAAAAAMKRARAEQEEWDKRKRTLADELKAVNDIIDARVKLGREPTDLDQRILAADAEVQHFRELQARSPGFHEYEIGLARARLVLRELQELQRRTLVLEDARTEEANRLRVQQENIAGDVERQAEAAERAAAAMQEQVASAIDYSHIFDEFNLNQPGGTGGGRTFRPAQILAAPEGDINAELDALGASLDNIGSLGESAFMTVGNAIDFAAIRAGDFAAIMENIVEQMANLMLNRALSGLAGSLFGGASSGGDPPIQGFLDANYPRGGGAPVPDRALTSVNMTVVTQDANSFRRSERQVRSAAQRAMGWR